MALHSIAHNFAALSQLLRHDKRVIHEGENCKYNYIIMLQCCDSTLYILGIYNNNNYILVLVIFMVASRNLGCTIYLFPHCFFAQIDDNGEIFRIL